MKQMKKAIAGLLIAATFAQSNDAKAWKIGGAVGAAWEEAKGAVSNGVEQIGDAVEQVRDAAAEEAKRAEENARKAAEWAKQQAAEAERVAKKKLAEAEKALRENLQKAAEFPITIATKIGNEVKNVTVKAGETLSDAVERTQKGLEHLSTESFRQYQVLERNIEKVKAVNQELSQQISSLKVQKANLPILSNAAGYLGDAAAKLDPSKISTAQIGNAVKWDDFTSNVSMNNVTGVLDKIKENSVDKILDAVDRTTSPVSQWLEDKVWEPAADYVSEKGVEFNKWVIASANAGSDELQNWSDYWADVNTDVNNLTWNSPRKELDKFAEWFEERTGAKECRQHNGLQSKRNRLQCLDEQIASIQVTIDAQNGLRFGLWATFRNSLMVKVNDAKQFIKLEMGDETSTGGFGLQQNSTEIASVKSEVSELVCNTDWNANTPQPRAIKVRLHTQYIRIPTTQFGSIAQQGVYNVDSDVVVDSLACTTIPVKGTAIDIEGRQLSFQTTYQLGRIIDTTTTTPSTGTRQIVSVNASDGRNVNFNLANCSQTGSSTGGRTEVDGFGLSSSEECPQSGSVPKEEQDKIWDGLGYRDLDDAVENRKEQKGDLDDTLARVTHSLSDCDLNLQLINIAQKDLMEIDPGIFNSGSNPSIYTCSPSEMNGFKSMVEDLQKTLTKLDSESFGFASTLLNYALRNIGKAAVSDADCNSIPGLRSKLDRLGGDATAATDELLRDHISSLSGGRARYADYLAAACWAKEFAKRQNQFSKASDLQKTIAAAKHVAKSMGQDDARHALIVQRNRIADAKARLNAAAGEVRIQKAAAIDTAELALDGADVALQEGDVDTANRAIDYARMALDFATDFGPVGSIKSAISIVTGKNPITGQQLEPLDYVFATIDVFDFVGGFRAAAKGARILGKIVAKEGKSAKLAEKLLQKAKEADTVVAKGRFPCAVSLTDITDNPCGKVIGEITDEMIEWGEKIGLKSEEELKAYAKYHSGVQASGIPVSAEKGFKFKPGAEDKVAVMGRSMGGDATKEIPNGVIDLRDSLNRAGINPSKVEIFYQDSKDVLTGNSVISDAAQAQFDAFKKTWGNAIPDDVLRDSLMYKENEAWIKKVKAQGYTIIDMGNPYDRATSAFYEMEKQIMWGP